MQKENARAKIHAQQQPLNNAIIEENGGRGLYEVEVFL